MPFYISLDKNVYDAIKRESIAATISFALRSYTDYLDRLSPNAEEMLKEITTLLRLNIVQKGRKTARVGISNMFVRRLMPLMYKYRITMSSIVNRAIQLYLRGHGIDIDFEHRAETQRKYICFQTFVNTNTLMKVRSYTRRYDHIIKKYVTYFEHLDAKDKLDELALISSIEDPQPRTKKLYVCSKAAELLDEMHKKYGIERKYLLLRAIQWHKSCEA